MSLFLGLDTSNYTTSVALYDRNSGRIISKKKLLPVKNGELGLRQSDALFHHIKALPEMIESAFSESEKGDLAGVGVSVRPRNLPGSYMPVFMAGEAAARSVAASHHVSCFEFSHQEGHLAAALWSAGRLDLFNKRFLAFHVSGGTTEALLVDGTNQALSVKEVACSLDLKAGQAIDRTGVMLGLPFPAGPHLEKLALTCKDDFKIKPSMKGADCSFSGIQNRCEQMKKQGAPAESVAKYCILAVMAALDAMCEALLKQYGPLPVVFMGGVMSCSLIREEFEKKYNGIFAQPAFSSDNAAGIAILAALNKE